MTRLTLLGDVDLRRDDGTTVGSVLSQPRRFGLLVYLALESHGAGVPADRLLALFWPETPAERAKASLRSAVYFLRRSLAGAVTRQGDLIGLDRSRVSCDAAEFRAALARGDMEEGVGLYRGALLSGWHADGVSTEFEQWVDGERAELQRSAVDASWGLALAQEAAGHAVAAGAWARRSLELSDRDEAAARRCIEFLGRIGDRAGALDSYRALERWLRLELEAEPSSATRAVLATALATSRPTAAPAPAATVPGGTPASVPEASAPFPVAPLPRGAAPASGVARPPARRSPLRRLGSGAVTLALVVAFYSLWGLNRPDDRRAHAADPERRPVLHLEELRDFSLDGSAAGLAGALGVELSARLTETDRIVVVSGEAAAGGEKPSYVLRGGLVRSDSTARITLVLVDGESGATLDRIGADGAVASAAGVEELAGELAREIRRQLGRVVDDHELRTTVRNARALDLLRSGLADARGADSLHRAGAAPAALVSLAAADAQLAAAQAAAPRWAEPSVRRASLAFSAMWISLLPPLADADSVAAHLRAGIEHAETALGIARNDPAALEMRGTLGYWSWRTRSGGSEAADELALARAEADLRRATDLDPGRARAWGLLSGILESRGDFAAANLAARRAHRMDAYLGDAPDILARLFTTSVEVGDLPAARRWCEELGERGWMGWIVLQCRLELMAWQPDPGPDAAALRDMIDMETSHSSAGRQARPRLEMLAAVVLAKSGLHDDALAFIQAARSAGSPDPHLLQLEGWAQLAMDDRSSAVALLRRAFQVNPRLAPAATASRRFAPIRDELAAAGTLAIAP